jgi:hypothetical protein
MKTISISLYNRPDYTKSLFNFLDNCMGIDDYKIIITVEPVNDDVIELAKKFRPEQTSVYVNSRQLGCSPNIYKAINKAFEISDFNIHFEDDIMPSKDCLQYFDFCNKEFKKDKSVLSVTGYSRGNNNEPDKIYKDNWFFPWGWATWKGRWEIIKYNWPKDQWDVPTTELLLTNKMYQIKPVVARTQNIGSEGGTFVPDANWHRENQYNEHWIESTKEYKNKFYLK